MANKYCCTPIPDKKEIESLYSKNMTQSEIGQKFGVTQKVVYSWFKKLGIKARVALTGKYHDIFDYKRMCVKCHRQFDAARR